MNANVLTSLIGLVAMQFVLYAVGWLVCGALVRQLRKQVYYFAAFMGAIGLGFVLMAMRGEARSWLAFCGSSLAYLSGLVCLWRGLAVHLGLPSRHLVQGLVLTFATVALALLGPDLIHAPWRVVMTYGGCMLLVACVLVDAYRGIGPRYGFETFRYLLAPGGLVLFGFSVPLLRQLLHLDVPFELQQFNESNQEALLAFLVAAALFNFAFMGLVVSRLLGELRRMSEHDPLTALHNRRAFDAALALEWRRWQRRGEPFALLAFDIDHFKRINDTLGHPGGDAVLVEVARRLKAVARESDTVARTGGEEFMLLMPYTDVAGAAAAGERMRCAVADMPFEVAGATRAVTISVGVAICSRADPQVRAVVERSDGLLYRAKQGGRNRVETALA